MTPVAQTATFPQPIASETIALLRGVSILASLTEDRLQCLAGSRPLHLESGDILIQQGEVRRNFWILLTGTLKISSTSSGEEDQYTVIVEAGNAFGEVPLLAGMPSAITLTACEPCELLELDEDQFWNLMTQCPVVRKAILGNMAVRLAKMQNATFQQEKMASLGNMAAGLMHELNNPGAAARRASSQLRTNLVRLHELGARFTRTTLTELQKDCILDLQHYALSARPELTLSTLEQTDAEESLADWMERAHVADAWKLAPTLVGIGFDAHVLECARSTFDEQTFSDALNWLEALVSSMQLVGTIEESISRVTDLVQAVKYYAYEGRGPKQTIDVNQSIHATLVILAHKLREKQITIEKSFGANLPPLKADCMGINQVWTNLLDNAIDAAPPSGHIRLSTWAETNHEKQEICVLVEDNGAGIPVDCQAHIFDAFFTTKPVGEGTGLGLGIVHRIVNQCGGTIHFASSEGSTEFVVRLPTAS